MNLLYYRWMPHNRLKEREELQLTVPSNCSSEPIPSREPGCGLPNVAAVQPLTTAHTTSPFCTGAFQKNFSVWALSPLHNMSISQYSTKAPKDKKWKQTERILFLGDQAGGYTAGKRDPVFWTEDYWGCIDSLPSWVIRPQWTVAHTSKIQILLRGWETPEQIEM